MSQYMFQFTYTPEAWATLSKNPADRTDSFRAIIEKRGWSFESQPDDRAADD